MADAQFRYIGKKRRTKEDPRFVIGRGRFVADIALAGMKHVALVASPYPSARILAIRAEAALAVPGVRYVLSGQEFCAHTDSLAIGVDAPSVTRYALACDVVRYAGEWVAAVVADTRAIAEDAAELVEVDYAPTPHVVDPEYAVKADSPLVHPAHGSNILFHRRFVWGPVEPAFAQADHTLALRAVWGRSSTVPIETFGIAAQWDPGQQMLDIWASIQMPKYPDQAARALRLPGNAVRVHYDVDVGGSYGGKRGIKHTVLVGYLAKKLGMPMRLIEDRLDNMRGGDAHGPDRIFDIEVAFDNDGTLRALKIRALDDVGAYAGRAPLQLGKPVSAICGPYRVAAIEYEPTSVMTHKTPQEAVRGFGQGPTNFALERTIDHVARYLGMDPLELRRDLRLGRLPHRARQGARGDRLSGAGGAARSGTRFGPPCRNRNFHLSRTERRQFGVRAAVQSEKRHHHVDGLVPGSHRSVGRDHRRDEHIIRWSGPRDARLDGDRRSARARSRHHPRGARRFALGAALQ